MTKVCEAFGVMEGTCGAVSSGRGALAHRGRWEGLDSWVGAKQSRGMRTRSDKR